MAEDFSDMFSKENPNLILGICSACEKEAGIGQKTYTERGWNVSHGVCGRHASQFFKSAGIDINTPKIKDMIDKNNTRDLSDPKNKPLVDWLKNPPLSPTLQKQQAKAA